MSTSLAQPPSAIAARDARAASVRIEAPPPRRESNAMKAFYVVSSILLPPLAVAVRTGDPCETAINIGWLCLGWLPGVIHSVLVTIGTSRCSCIPDAAMAVPPGQRIEEVVSTRLAQADAPAAAAAPVARVAI